MDKINILLVTVQLETIGGSERLIYNLASQLDRNVFNPFVAWLEGNGVLEEFTTLGIPLIHIPKKSRVDISTIRNISRLIRLNNIHIVNAHHFMPMLYSFYGSKVGNTVKLFYTEHSQWEIQQIPWKWQSIGSYLLNRSDGAIGVSPAVSQEIQSKFGMPAKNVYSIVNGVDIKAFSAKKDKPAIRTGLGLSADDKTIGIVANFKKVKNHMYLVKAFHELIKEDKNIKLLMIGEGYENDPENSELEIRGYVHENGLDEYVMYLGYRTDIPSILGILDIFCMTSFKEGLPISLIEAMAAGLPVVGTDVEGIRDVIISGYNGFLVQLGDVAGLKDTLKCLLQNDSLRLRIGQESSATARRDYSLGTCINKYEDIFTASMTSVASQY